MARLTDPDRLKAYRDALQNWRFENFVRFQLREAHYQWIKGNLPGISLKEISMLMNEYVENGGEIDEQPETRELWSEDYEFHHDLRFPINGVHTYIETCLTYRVPVLSDRSSILVVSIHAV